jgi:hypothetical protein
MELESKMEALVEDAAELFLACVESENVDYSTVVCNSHTTPDEVKSEIFKSISNYQDNPYRLFKLFAIIMIVVHDSNQDYYNMRGLQDDQDLFIDFMDKVKSHEKVEQFLDLHYTIFINTR